MNNHFNVKDSKEFFVTKNATRYLLNGSIERCICSHHMTDEFYWILEFDFLKLKGDYTPVNTEEYDRSTEQFDPRDPKEIAFWRKFKELEAESNDGTVEENALKNGLLYDDNTFGTMPAVNNMIEGMFNMGIIDTAGKSGYYRRTRTIDNDSNDHDR